MLESIGCGLNNHQLHTADSYTVSQISILQMNYIQLVCTALRHSFERFFFIQRLVSVCKPGRLTLVRIPCMWGILSEYAICFIILAVFRCQHRTFASVRPVMVEKVMTWQIDTVFRLLIYCPFKWFRKKAILAMYRHNMARHQNQKQISFLSGCL